MAVSSTNCVVWSWGCTKKWFPYGPDASNGIEAASSQNNYLIDLGQFDTSLKNYNIDLSNMIQVSLRGSGRGRSGKYILEQIFLFKLE